MRVPNVDAFALQLAGGLMLAGRKPITRPMNREQIFWLARIFLDLQAQPCDHVVHTAGSRQTFESPDKLQQFVPGHHFTRAIAHVMKKLHLVLRE